MLLCLRKHSVHMGKRSKLNIHPVRETLQSYGAKGRSTPPRKGCTPQERTLHPANHVPTCRKQTPLDARPRRSVQGHCTEISGVTHVNKDCTNLNTLATRRRSTYGRQPRISLSTETRLKEERTETGNPQKEKLPVSVQGY